MDMRVRGMFWAAMAAISVGLLGASMGTRADDKYPVGDCGQYVKAIASEKSLMALLPAIKRSEDMQELLALSNQCKTSTSSLARVLREFNSYDDISMHRDLPNSMARDPSLTDEQLQKLLDDEFDQEEEELAQLRLKMMKANPTAFGAVMRFMIEQQGDEEYGAAAMEIIARNFPEQYDT